MLSLILNVIPALFFWAVFIYVIFYIPYPESLTKASSFQLLSFFIPIFLALIFSINIIFKNVTRSILISFGVIILLALKALDSLNFVSAILTILAMILLFSYFKKNAHLTSGSFIPKLKNLRRKK